MPNHRDEDQSARPHQLSEETRDTGAGPAHESPFASAAPIRPNKNGVIIPRLKRPGWSDLVDPRDPPWEDRVAAARRELKLRATRTSALDLGGRRMAPPSVRLQSEVVSNAIYRYSKGPDFTNDELGYGEVIEEEIWLIQDGKATSHKRISQRTKTGRQILQVVPPITRAK
jgi:hypothetical protein